MLFSAVNGIGGRENGMAGDRYVGHSVSCARCGVQAEEGMGIREWRVVWGMWGGKEGSVPDVLERRKKENVVVCANLGAGGPAVLMLRRELAVHKFAP
jgi:hypothetical protein